jgi:hypothetical protein
LPPPVITTTFPSMFVLMMFSLLLCEELYAGKTAVKFNIPEAEAVDRLKDLIREHGKWVDPAPQATDVEAVS